MERVLAERGLLCTGCGACSAACPAHAICMMADDDGFLKARIDATRCVHCGKCEKTCPVLNPDYSNGDPTCHAMQAQDSDRMLSSSGGVFPVLARDTWERGGTVFGAVWNDDFSVSIIGTDDPSDLGRLRKSKYVQSNTEETFSEAKRLLDAGKPVLYSGCPCQIAGLKAFLGNLHDSSLLLTAEVVCHGNSSPSVLRERLDDEFGIDNVTSVDFKDKTTFGWGVGELVALKDGTTVIERESPYMDAFNPCLIMSRSCERCPFSRLPRQADLTLGDFWGIERFRPDLMDHKGLSVVLVNSQRGQAALDRVSDSIRVDEVLPLDYATEVNKTIIHPFPNHPGRKHFFMSRGMKPFDTLSKDALRHHYDVGIVGLWYGINYGSVLTYYALYELVRGFGKDPVLLPKPNGMWGERFNDPNSIAQRFMTDRCNVFLPYRSLSEYPLANDNCDMFLVGSDVVWSYDVCGHEVSQFFFLDWAKRDHRKVAYAASIGDGFGDDAKYVAGARRNLRLFDAVSAREQVGADAISELASRDDIERVMDPVFLCGRDAFDGLANEAHGTHARKGAMFAYLLQGAMLTQKRHWASLIADHLGMEKFVVGNASDHDAAHAIIGEEAILDIPVEDWVKSICDSGFYFGDSYHGLCFALMYHIPFLIVYPDDAPAKPRITSLLELVGLTDRLVEDDDTSDQEVLAIADAEIDWDSVDAILDAEVRKSRNWLKEALVDSRKAEPSESDLMHDEMIERVTLLAREVSDMRADMDGHMSEELQDIRSSWFFRIGRLATWVPRHARDLIRHHMRNLSIMQRTR